MNWRPENTPRLLLNLPLFALGAFSLLTPFTTPVWLCPANFNPHSYYFLAYFLRYFLIDGILIATGAVVVGLGRRTERHDPAKPQPHNQDAQGHAGR